MIKTKKQMYVVIGVFALVMLLGTVTYAFFNYTRTGLANTVSTGRISFTSSQSGTFNLTNVFPVTRTEAASDNTNSSEVVITITGDTTYTNGLEYLVTVEDVVTETSTHKKLPIGLIVTAEENSSELGTANANYFNAANNGGRGGSTSYYKVLKGETAGDTLKDGDYILVGYIRHGVAEVNGQLGIRAFIDKDKILVSDTYDGTESDNMGTLSSMATNKVVLTTTEWNALQGNNALSFKVKVQSNEGIWVGEPLSRNDMNSLLPLFNSGGAFEGQKSSITEINFIRMSEEMINMHSNVVDLTASGGQGVVKTWIDGTKLYIASPGKTYFPTSSNSLFSGFTNVTKINFNNIDTSAVTSMATMFINCSSLSSIDLSSFNTSNVTNMAQMFDSCSGLTSIDLSGMGNNNLIYVGGMFAGASSLTSINMSSFNFGASNIAGLFVNVANLQVVDLSNANISDVTNMSGMFSGSSALTTIYVSNTWTINDGIYTTGMFAGCTSLVGGAGTRFENSNPTDKTYARIDGGPNSLTPGYLTLKN